LELDGHTRSGVRGKAEVVCQPVVGAGRRGFYGVGVSRGGAGAIAATSNGEPSEEWFEDSTKRVNMKGERMSLLQCAAVDVERRGGAVGGVAIGGGDHVYLFARVHKGEGHTKLAPVFEHYAVVRSVEGALGVRLHGTYILIIYFSVLHHNNDGDHGNVDA
jgi:hypothetical protein